MAVAAYASVISLSHVLDQIQHSARLRLLPNKKQIEALHEKVHFLQEFLELHSQGECDQIEDLARRIAEVAHEAEIIIDFHVVNQLRGGNDDKADTGILSFSQDIDKVIEKIESITKELLSMVKAEGKAVREAQLKVSVSAGPSKLPSGGKSTGVGLDEQLVQIMDRLTGYQLDLQIIPITGMGGIGKTTLARLAFENKLIVEHFDVRVWFTISQEYSIHEILIGILHDIGVVGDLKSETLAELGQRLHKQLFDRRYLIVMDDMWSNEAWDDFKLSFPNNGNKSRIIVTTRLSDVAASLSSCSPYSMNFLDEDKSWNLFCEKAFAHKNCTPELEEPGKKIAKSCKGLPLAIVVIGGCLANSDMTLEYWDFVAENINSYANLEKEEQCLEILALSYQHLPIHLKPCFLYMRVFSEDQKVKIPNLMKLWIAEGFVKPLKGKNLEDVADEYLKDLIDRNLILIHEPRTFLSIVSKTISIHDYLRDLCIRESQKERFFSLPKVHNIKTHLIKKSMCFLCSDENIVEEIHHGEVINGSESGSTTWVCDACRIKHPQLIRLRFINIMMFQTDHNHFKNILVPTTLRCLIAYKSSFVPLNSVSFPSMHLLWNLQALTIDGKFSEPIILPSEIWELSQIRHIEITKAILPDPPGERKETILENLHTLSDIFEFKLTGEVLKRIPNIKKLRASSSPDLLLTNFSHLIKLESLLLRNCILSSENIAFLHSLKELSLLGCHMQWKDMTMIGSLPNLEVLQLRNISSCDPEWNPVEGEFLRLKYLLMRSLDLVKWRAENVHFPCLETLVLIHLKSLDEISSSIGDIPTLSLIQLFGCNKKLEDSANQIIEEQRSMGNEDLKVNF